MRNRTRVWKAAMAACVALGIAVGVATIPAAAITITHPAPVGFQDGDDIILRVR